MKLTEEEKQSLIRNRVIRSFETWEETKGIIQINEYKDVNLNKIEFFGLFSKEVLW